MKKEIAACCSIALLCGLGTAAVASDTRHGDANGWGYCESRLAGNGYVYVTPVFAEPLGNPQGGFARYLAKTFGYDGGAVRCFSLPSKREAAEFRMQRIELFHWRSEDHILATNWTPEERQAPAASPSSATS